MRSERSAQVPQSLCSYTWKASASPHLRPALPENLRDVPYPAIERGEPASIPWKAYLAAREFQSLASDLADGVFSAPPDAALPDLTVPAILKSEGLVTTQKADGSLSKLLTPVVPADEDALKELDPGGQAFDFAAAA